MGSGAITQPTHVTIGVDGLVSSSNTSTDSRVPWPTTYSVCTVAGPGCSQSPCVLNRALGTVSGGPGHSGYFFSSIRRRAPTVG